ncbi:unnamed protein product, partial [Sphagnum compactum]
ISEALVSRHNITIITSIHQPNSDVLMMFDKLYVLAKGGVCVYSGRPQDLNTHLRECDILCNKFQFPIEVLLKIGTKGVNDKQVLKLAKKSSEEKQSLLNRCENETKLFSNGIPFKSKNFKLIDIDEKIILRQLNGSVEFGSLNALMGPSELDHENSIKNLMIDLLITDIEDTNVEKCSKGEQKRLVMAMEMTSYKKPNLICIDEPTSGLDSNAAEVVIKCLKVLSRKHNITIIISIHQPNSDVLMMFDMLYVLAKGGNCVYSGRPQDLNTHLNE